MTDPAAPPHPPIYAKAPAKRPRRIDHGAPPKNYDQGHVAKHELIPTPAPPPKPPE